MPVFYFPANMSVPLPREGGSFPAGLVSVSSMLGEGSGPENIRKHLLRRKEGRKDGRMDGWMNYHKKLL